ncbi:VOC family protein [Rhizobium mongolense]|uniref:VOC family protein n=1 Tax=Rhizobium mongolense TaxID=57676 RepID=UPI0034A24FD1
MGHHLDLFVSNQKTEVERLLSIGAQRVNWRDREEADDIVLADPDGNTFCVIQKE